MLGACHVYGRSSFLNWPLFLVTLPQNTMPTTQEEAGFVRVEWVMPSNIPPVSLLCVSDTHDQQAYMPNALPKADILIHAGDFTCSGCRAEVQAFQQWTQQLLDNDTVKEVVFVAGNHDVSLELKAKIPAARRAQQELKRCLVERPHTHYLEDESSTVMGVNFYGSPWTTRCGRDWGFQSLDTDDPGRMPPGEKCLGEKFAAIPKGIDVLVTHQPPFGQGDNDTFKRIGSVMLKQAIERSRPAL